MAIFITCDNEIRDFEPGAAVTKNFWRICFGRMVTGFCLCKAKKRIFVTKRENVLNALSVLIIGCPSLREDVHL